MYLSRIFVEYKNNVNLSMDRFFSLTFSLSLLLAEWSICIHLHTNLAPLSIVDFFDYIGNLLVIVRMCLEHFFPFSHFCTPPTLFLCTESLLLFHFTSFNLHSSPIPLVYYPNPITFKPLFSASQDPPLFLLLSSHWRLNFFFVPPAMPSNFSPTEIFWMCTKCSQAQNTHAHTSRSHSHSRATLNAVEKFQFANRGIGYSCW